MFVAAEIVHARRGQAGVTQRRPWVVAFLFGILHGFGFADALSEVGLPQHAIPLALLFFNGGVEAGQLAFIAVALAGIALLRRSPLRAPTWASHAPVYALGGLGAFWMLGRLAGFA